MFLLYNKCRNGEDYMQKFNSLTDTTIDKKLEIITTEASKYFSLKNYIFMLLILIFTVTGIRSYWKKNK